MLGVKKTFFYSPLGKEKVEDLLLRSEGNGSLLTEGQSSAVMPCQPFYHALVIYTDPCSEAVLFVCLSVCLSMSLSASLSLSLTLSSFVCLSVPVF